MRIYILGITGMLGAELFYRFSQLTEHKIRGCTRKKPENFFLKNNKMIDFNVSVKNLKKLKKKIYDFNPDYIINCVGYVKQKISKKTNKNEVIFVNSIFPKELLLLIKNLNARIIHFSTDCVFDGKMGNYNDRSKPNAKDLYGRSKYLGELNHPKVITIRTSIIGHEISTKNGLLEWFLSKKNKCQGYANSFFSGLTTFEIFNFINNYLFKKNISGIYNLSSKKISKYYLLKMIAKIYKKKIIIKKNFSKKIDRSLNSKLIKEKLKYKSPSWKKMLETMYANKRNLNYN
jgi:dTDP-4-dehydrorhamnose reductase